MSLADISRQRIDFEPMPGGAEKAILTVTLPGGIVKRYEAVTTPAEVEEISGELVGMEVGFFGGVDEVGRTSADKLSDAQSRARIALSWHDVKFDKKKPKGWKYDAPFATQQRWWESLSADRRKAYKIRYAAIVDNAPVTGDDARNQWWRKLTKDKRTKLRDPYDTTLLEGVGNVVKKVASSKVFQLAAKGLALAAPVLGPLAPAALAVSAGLGVAGKLAKAGVAASKGAKGVAAALTKSAVADAKKLTKTAEGARDLLATANSKRKAVDAIVAKAPKKKTAPKKKPAPAKAAKAPAAAPATSDLLARARAGRVRSNRGGAVSPATLLQAHQSGRVFWVH